MYDFKDMKSGKKGIERGVAVALPRLQYRAATHKPNAQPPYCKPAQPKMADAIFGFGLTHAPSQPQELDRKNTIVGKCSRKAATATNKQFGTMAGVACRKAL